VAFRRRSGVIRSAGFNQSQRRKTEWVASSVPAGVNALANNTIAFDQQSDINEPQTLIRTRGYLFVQSDQTAAREEAFGAFGIAVVKTPAAAIGVTALPSPLDEMGDDVWYVWVPWACTGQPTGFSETVFSMPFDSKGQRKLADGDTLVALIQNSASGFGVEFEMFWRELVMLH